MSKIFLILIVVIFCFSCRKDKAPILGPAGVSCALPAQVSYQQHIQPIFNMYCVNGGCHAGGSPAGNLSLDASVSYSQLMKSGSGNIDVAQPNFSLLYSQMNSSSNPMPQTGRLDSCTIGLVFKWIQQGAKNN